MTERTCHVIGRGIIGLSIAWALARRGLRVVLLGPSARPGTASRAAVGVSALKGQVVPGAPLFALKMRGHAALPGWLAALEAASGKAIPRMFNGVFEPFWTPTEYAGIVRRVFHNSFTGCLQVETRGPGAYPVPAPGAIHYPSDGWFDPDAALDALEAALDRLGATRDEALVRAVEPHPDAGLVLTTDSGPLHVAEAVLAAGVFSNEILENSNVYHLHRQAVRPLLQVRAPGASARGTASVDLPDGVAKIGKQNVIVHNRQWLIGAGDPQVLPPLIHRFLPGSPWRQVDGVRGRTANRQPALGAFMFPSCARRLWYALGYYKNGLQLAPLAAEDLALQISQS